MKSKTRPKLIIDWAPLPGGFVAPSAPEAREWLPPEPDPAPDPAVDPERAPEPGPADEDPGVDVGWRLNTFDPSATGPRKEQ